jgi:hypothetical protein
METFFSTNSPSPPFLLFFLLSPKFHQDFLLVSPFLAKLGEEMMSNMMMGQVNELGVVMCYLPIGLPRVEPDQFRLFPAILFF